MPLLFAKTYTCKHRERLAPRKCCRHPYGLFYNKHAHIHRYAQAYGVPHTHTHTSAGTNDHKLRGSLQWTLRTWIKECNSCGNRGIEWEEAAVYAVGYWICHNVLLHLRSLKCSRRRYVSWIIVYASQAHPSLWFVRLRQTQLEEHLRLFPLCSLFMKTTFSSRPETVAFVPTIPRHCFPHPSSRFYKPRQTTKDHSIIILPG